MEMSKMDNDSAFSLSEGEPADNTEITGLPTSHDYCLFNNCTMISF